MKVEMKEYKEHLKEASRKIVFVTVEASKSLPEPFRSQQIEIAVNKWISGQKRNYADRKAKNNAWGLSQQEWDLMIDELNIKVLSEYRLKKLKNKIISHIPSRNSKKSWFLKLFNSK